MVTALLMAPCHVVATMRSKTEYVLEQRNGKSVPVKVGMAPVQRPGIDYEFTVTCELDRDHNIVVDKSRCEAIADKVFGPGEAVQLGQTLHAWLSTAEPSPLAVLRARRDALPLEGQAKVDAWLAKGEVTLETLPSAWFDAAREVLDKAEQAATP